MKTLNYPLALFFLLIDIDILDAKPVLETTAATVAENYYTHIYHVHGETLSLAYTERSSEGQAVYYVFNVNPSQGFVIVSAEDAGHSVLGSSNTGQYVIPTSNNNVAFWMNRRKNEIISMRAHNVQPSAAIAAEWNEYIHNVERNKPTTTVAPVAPLLVGITWDQSPYYNALCPGGSVTGCVATAMAQIMRYWQYPSAGTGSSCYDDEQSQGYQENYGELCANFDTSSYSWSEMPMNVTCSNPAVAKLMYDCGISLNMDYSPSGSEAYLFPGAGPCAQTSYVQYFKYDSTTIQGVYESSYSNSAWVALIENEAANGRPVQFQGIDPNQGGHSWVCDGFNSENELHMNWGWGGADNGYFIADSLAVDGFYFSEYVGALIGIKPPVNVTLGVNQLSSNTGIKAYPNPSHGVFNFTLPNNSTSYLVAIYNTLGEEINTSTINSVNNTVNVSREAKGVYIYKLLSETGSLVSTGRLVVE